MACKVSISALRDVSMCTFVMMHTYHIQEDLCASVADPVGFHPLPLKPPHLASPSSYAALTDLAQPAFQQLLNQKLGGAPRRKWACMRILLLKPPL